MRSGGSITISCWRRGARIAWPLLPGARDRRAPARCASSAPISRGTRRRPRCISNSPADGVHVDYLVNNAGFGTTGRFHLLPLERELEEIELNVTSLVAMTRLFLPAMVERQRGTVINVASTAAFQPTPYMATYGATKAFVLSFSEAVAAEFSGTGVTVMALVSGSGAYRVSESRQ